MGTRKQFLAAVACLLLITVAAAAAQRCPSGFLPCHSGECIRQAKICDGQQDCKDSSDESDCDIKCQPPDFFRCHNGRCVSHHFVCDGEDECGDGSDEMDCDGGTHSSPAFSNCTKDEFRCTDGLCIPKHWKCDGNPDCLDGSDELLGCTDQNMCEDKGFLCANHHCIPQEWRCDGQDDCTDNSDELGCHLQPSHPVDCSLDRHLYACHDHSCVELTELCDGVSQCPDGSDEGPACNDSISQCKSYGCSHRCYPTPTGPICTCPKGFVVSREKYCSDINECEEYGLCSQICNNIPGSFECKCAPHFELDRNNKSCKAIGPEALLVYALKTEVRAFFLTSKVMWPVAMNQAHVAGVAYDGIHMYWTSLENGEEAIIRSKEDGSDKEVVINAGLSLPEDLAIDWLTSNIYFTDGEEKHIGVCSTTGKVCTVIVTEDVDAPRAIALHLSEGYVYWTDWGDRPMVARAGMDGSSVTAFVDSNIEWPNGLALDIPNRRLYWIDAKLSLVESIKFDGTDRRTILSGVVKHPYALAVFEDYLYWSDFKTSEILSCNKFTGKEQRKIAHSRDNYVYGIDIYHPSLHPEMTSACDNAKCSDICLLAPNQTYTCACPENKIINEDHHTCTEIEKHEGLAIAAGHLMIRLEHSLLGKQEYTSVYLKSVYKIGALAYNSLTGEVFFSDLAKRAVFAMDMKEKLSSAKELVTSGIGSIVAMDFDHLGNNLYWCDAERQTIEVMSLATLKRMVLLATYGEQTPLAITVLSEEGVMFVAFKKYDGNRFHIDRIHLDGSGLTHIIEETLRGPTISLAYDSQMKRVFFSDSGRRTIESISVEGTDYHRYAELIQQPLSLATLGRELFWTSNERTHLHWSSKYTAYSKVKQLALEMLNGEDLIVATALRSLFATPDHPCHKGNGGCSHLCLVTNKNMVCACPSDLELDTNKRTCLTPMRCAKDKFKCIVENQCIPKALRCDGKPDCSAGEDERDCPTKCSVLEFTCNNGQCIPYGQKCDKKEQCNDGSDEFNCDKEMCNEDEFQCLSGECINTAMRCDMRSDCRDNSDEDCVDVTCPPHRFRCNSGSCIPEAWECDGEANCIDGSDEHEKCPTTKCSPEDFQCANRRCIDKSLRCNRRDDCGDNSDEQGCPDDSGQLEPLYCKEDEFKCHLVKQMCVPGAARCNGSAECLKGEDELDCGCRDNQFECDHGRCLDRSWLCDGTNDCDDRKDEDPTECNDGKVAPTPATCPDFKCKTGECLSLEQVCDGLPQCSDGSDEGGKCSTACILGNPCKEEEICRPTPAGSRCTCKSGYEVPRDSTECRDIDECTLNLCAQICNNTPGSYSCSCVRGYHLRLDRRSCKAAGEAMQVIYVTNGNEIRMAPYSLQRIQVLHQNTGIRIEGLDVNVPKRMIYWSTGIRGAIFYTSLVSKTTRNVTNLGYPGELAVDWVTGNIYFVDEQDSKQTSIKVCNFESKKCAKVLSAEEEMKIDNLVVDPYSGFMFWTEISLATFNEPHSVIKRADMSGKNGLTIINGLEIISGLAVDSIHTTLFWVDRQKSQVGSVGYRGEDTQIIFDKQLVERPSRLVLFEDSLYWISTESGKLMKCRVYGTPRKCDSVELNSHFVEYFTIHQEQRQAPVENYCLNLECSHICVGSSTGAECLCPDGTLVENKTPCEEHYAGSKPEFPEATPLRSRHRLSDGAVIAIILAVLLIGVILFGIYIWTIKGIPIWDPRVLFRQNPYRQTLKESEEEVVHYSSLQKKLPAAVAATAALEETDASPQQPTSRPTQKASIPLTRVQKTPSQQSLGHETAFSQETQRLIP